MEKQTNASFQLQIAGLNAHLSIDQQSVHLNANLNLQYRLNRKTGVIEFLNNEGVEPDFAEIKTAIEAKLQEKNSEYETAIQVAQ